MFEVLVLIPVLSNEGSRFSSNHHEAFESYVVDRFGGVTLYPSNAIGTWIDAGKTYHDETRVYGFAVKSIAQGDKVAQVATFAKTHYAQLAIYIRYLGLSEIL